MIFRFFLVLFTMLFMAPPLARADPAATFDQIRYSGRDPYATTPLLAGQYRNPVLPGFHPDPSIVRVGRDFYLVNSSFAFFPGLPIFHSRDLVNWRQIGNAVTDPGAFDFKGLGISRALFAPTIRYKAGTFYIVNTCVDCRGNFIITARNPAGPWSSPVWLPEIDGIDTDLFFDDDGRAWIANNGPPIGTPRYEGHRAIWIQEFDVARKAMKGPRTMLVDGGVRPQDNPIWAEGPHIIKRDGWYYMIAAEGGTAGDHSQTVYRSRAVTGPYEPGPVNPILTQRDLPADRPERVEATGHADFVELPDGSWWSVFLATRPYERNLSNLGRETFLYPISWPRGGWPLILPAKTPLPLVARRPTLPPDRPVVRDRWTATFPGGRLPPEWLMIRNPVSPWYRLARDRVTISARPVSLGDTGNPSFLARRQEHAHADFEARVRFDPTAEGDRAGLAVFADERHFYFAGLMRLEGKRQIVVMRRNGAADPASGTVIASRPIAVTADPRIRMRFVDGRVHVDYAVGQGSFVPLIENADGRILASEPTNLFTGTVVGLFAQRER